MSGRPSTTAGMMRLLATWISIIDQDPTRSDEVQQDLRKLAVWLDEHPDVDNAMHAAVEAKP